MTVEETKRLIRNIYDRVIENSMADAFKGLKNEEIDEREYFNKVVKNCIRELKHYKAVTNGVRDES